MEIIGGVISLASIIAGGGFYLRHQKKQKLTQDNAVARSRSMGEIVDDFNTRMAKMSLRLAALMEKQTELSRLVTEQRGELLTLRAENQELRAEIERLTAQSAQT